MLKTAISMLRDEAGQGLVEYALIIALVSLAAIAILGTLGSRVNTTLSTATSQLS